MADSVTVLRALGGRCLAKRVLPDGGFADYDRAWRFNLYRRRIADLAALADLLADLAPRRTFCVVRGSVADPTRMCDVRRLVHPDPETGDPPTLVAAPRCWLANDADSVPLPPDLDPADLAGCAAAVLAHFPPAFAGAACIVQATAGHGIKPGARLRLWHWLDHALGRAALDAWFAGCPVDRSVFRPAQIIFTAGPVFGDGQADHLPARLLMLTGRPVVEVPADVVRVEAKRPPGQPMPTVPKPPKPPPKPMPGKGGGGRRYAVAALRNATVRVAAAAESERHATALREACGLVRLVERGDLTEAEAMSAMDGGLILAGKAPGEGESIVRWALTRATVDVGGVFNHE